MFNRVVSWQWTPTAMIALGVAFRLLWLWFQPERAPDYGEAGNIAYAVFSKSEFADAFRQGQGPTAHMMPASPLIAGGVFKVFGYNTPAANLFLSLWALGLMATALLLQFKTFVLLGLRRTYALVALAFLCFVPLNFAREVIWFRVWEGALAVALASLILYLLVKWDGQPFRVARVWAGAALIGLLFFVQPPLGLGAAAAAILFASRNLSFVQTVEAGCVAIVIAMALMVPWAIRNDRAIGEPIFTRSNFGLETALAFHQGALSAQPGEAYRRRMLEIHPYPIEGAGYEKMQAAGGEVAYFARLKQETKQWMIDSPGATLTLMGTHARDMFFPSAWQLENANQATAKMLLHWLVSAMAIGGILLLRDVRQLYPFAVIAVTIIPYILVQPTIRYRYLIFSLLVFAGGLATQSTLEVVKSLIASRGKSRRQVERRPA